MNQFFKLNITHILLVLFVILFSNKLIFFHLWGDFVSSKYTGFLSLLIFTLYNSYDFWVLHLVFIYLMIWLFVMFYILFFQNLLLINFVSIN